MASLLVSHRYFVCASHTEACCVISRRVMPNASEDEGSEQNELISYYINDGVYGSFNCTLYDHVEVFPQVLFSGADSSTIAKAIPSTVWGPTCDSMDKVATSALPKLEIGDWLLFDDMGAYTCCASSNFNGFANPTSHYIFSAPADFDVGSLPNGFPFVDTTAATAST
jgi:ornithine decarboxylase